MSVAEGRIQGEAERFWEQCFRIGDYDYRSLAAKDYSPILERLRENGVRDVLDLGCGYGHWSMVLARAGFKVCAIDIAASAVGTLKLWAKEEGLTIATEVCRIQDLSFPSASFDAIISNSVLDHVLYADARQAVRTMQGLLKTDGLAFLTFDGMEKEDPRNYETLPDGTWHYVKGKQAGMLWRYCTDDEIKELFQGLKVLENQVRGNGRRAIWVQKTDQLPREDL